MGDSSDFCALLAGEGGFYRDRCGNISFQTPEFFSRRAEVRAVEGQNAVTMEEKAWNFD
jgi:hypothetical protein